MTAQIDWLRDQSRDRGEQDATAHLGSYALEYLRSVVRELAEAGEFTSDDVHAKLSPAIASSLELAPNALGALMRAEVSAGRIERTGQSVVSQRPDARGRRIPSWRRTEKAVS